MTTAQLTAGRGGRTGGRGRGAGRGTGRGNRHRTQFFGKNKELGVFETADERVKSGHGQNQFDDTLKNLSSYAAEKLSTKEGKTSIRDLLRDMTPFVQETPKKPTKIKIGLTADYDTFEKAAYLKEVDVQAHQMEAFKQGETTMWSVIWGQCSAKMHTQIEGLDDYEDMKTASNILKLLNAIKIIAYKFDHHRQQEISVTGVIEDLFSFRQGKQTLDVYHKNFKSRCDVIEQFGGSFGAHPIVTVRNMNESKKDGETLLTTKTLHEGLMAGTISYRDYYEQMEKAIESSKAALFLTHADNKYDPLLLELHNQYATGSNKYPATVDLAYNRMVTYKLPNSNRRDRRTEGANPNTDQLAFVQAGARDQNEFPDVLCYRCQNMGHYSSSCTTTPTTENTTTDSISAIIIRDPPVLDRDPDLCFYNSATASVAYADEIG
jgi:hypothetical protein